MDGLLNMKGKLIVFEGVEGCGKTTQIKRSQVWLQESNWLTRLQAQGCLKDLRMTREPGGTEIGQEMRQILLHPQSQEPIHSRAELLLYAADRAQHVEAMLKPDLEAGWLILCDRYTDSTVAYQGYGRGLNLDLIHQLNSIATHDLKSDLTLWLDLDVEIGLARTQRRGVADRMEQSSLDFHRRVQQGFAELAKMDSDRSIRRIVRIDANQSEEDVAQQIQTVLHQRFTEWYPMLLTPYLTP
jgi:dTMP kinase